MTEPKVSLARSRPAAARLRATPVRVLNTWWDLVCAFVLLLPSDTLGSSPGYRIVHLLLRHDWIVGVLLLAVAAIRLTAMIRPLLKRRRGQLAGLAAMLGFLVWMIVAVGIFIATPASLGGYAYLGIAGAHAWSYIEARMEDG